MKDSEIRKRLKAAIRCLSAVLILSVVSGAVLLNSIGSTNGWGRTEKQEDEIYTKEQIDKFITSVLIIVQNQPLSSDKAGADMVFIASFDSFRQRLTMAALYSQMEINGAALSNIYANSGPGGLVNAVNDGFGLDIEYYACTDTASLGAMIDLLGGITVKVDFSEADYINKALGEKSVNAGREPEHDIRHGRHKRRGADGRPEAPPGACRICGEEYAQDCHKGGNAAIAQPRCGQYKD